MAEQNRVTRRPADPEPSEPPAAQAVRAQIDDDKLDDLLDEIDTVLENNSEEFVRSFVQKGGQ